MPTAVAFTKRASQLLGSVTFWRGTVAIVAFILILEIASRTGLSRVPAPSGVVLTFNDLMRDPSYWFSWYLSVRRVFTGFIAAMLLGIPLGLGMAVSRTFYGISFPVFEVFRPIPRLAWFRPPLLFCPSQ